MFFWISKRRIFDFPALRIQLNEVINAAPINRFLLLKILDLQFTKYDLPNVIFQIKLSKIIQSTFYITYFHYTY
jgi:hypothetical protein